MQTEQLKMVGAETSEAGFRTVTQQNKFSGHQFNLVDLKQLLLETIHKLKLSNKSSYKFQGCIYPGEDNTGGESGILYDLKTFYNNLKLKQMNKVLFFIAVSLSLIIGIWLLIELFEIIPIYNDVKIDDLSGVHRVLFAGWLFFKVLLGYALGIGVYSIYKPLMKRIWRFY